VRPAPGERSRLPRGVGRATNCAYVRLISRVKDVKELAGERDALSSAIEKTHDSKRLINLINCLVAATKAAGTSTQSSADVALLLRKVSELRAKNEYETFASDIVELVRLGGVTMPVDHVGLIYAAVLLELSRLTGRIV
jgi:hypothetical protein